LIIPRKISTRGQLYRLLLVFTLSFAILIAALPAKAFPAESETEKAVRRYYQEALSSLAQGDSSAALSLLGKVLELDPKHWESWLERGRLHLAADELDAARDAFTRALFSKSPETRTMAHVGLGDIYRQMPKRNFDAVAEYQLAIRIDPACCEACYSLAQTGFALGETQDFRMAARALADLVCLDPDYKDTYVLWRDNLMDQTDQNLRLADRCLEKYISGRREKSAWWFDLAQVRYRLGEAERALEALDKLEKALPEHKPALRSLLRARCLLDLEDWTGFEYNYDLALKAAREKKDFSRLLIEAEPIFRPEEREKAGRLETAEEWEDFFRIFWKRRDPDPLTPTNERMIEHYRRLRQAEKLYTLLLPHNRFQDSRNYSRLVTLLNQPMPQQKPEPFIDIIPSEPLPYDYDPDLFRDRSPKLSLDQRGLLYLRHGPPDEVRVREDIGEGMGNSPPMIGRLKELFESNNPLEIWFYGSTFFVFDRPKGAGDYIYTPVAARGMGDINKAMETESYSDPLPLFRQDFYGADFQGPNGRIEVEFYQSVPVSAIKQTTPPGAAIAVYDNHWREIARDSTSSRKVFAGGDSLWIAANKVSVDPGRRIYAVRMDIPGCRAVKREVMELNPYRDDMLNLSGIILGSPPPAQGEDIYRRRGIEILPRPTLKFQANEIIAIYYEIYGLEKDPEGKRYFQEWVTVRLTGEKSAEETSLLNGIESLIKLGGKRAGSLTLTFEREPPGSSGTVVEHFTIDTSLLVPGRYRLNIEILDKSSGRKQQSGCFFELEEGGKEAIQ